MFVKHTKTQSGNQTLKTLLPKKHRKHHNHLKFNCFLSRSPSHRAKIEGQGDQYRGGDSSQGENRGVRGGGKGRYFKKDEEVVDWCGSICLGEKEVLGEVP